MLAITGGKGGCGKTTTTLGLAGALADAGANPLVVDADCDMPDVHHRAEVPHTPGVDALATGANLDAVVHESSKIPGVSVVPGGRRRHLGPALRRATEWSGPVLVDCAAGMNSDSLFPLRLADISVVVSTDRPQCLEDAVDSYLAARQLDARPLGVMIRDTGCEDSPTLPDDISILSRMQSHDRPLSLSQIRSTWTRLSASINASPETPDSRTETVSPGHNPVDVRNNQSR